MKGNTDSSIRMTMTGGCPNSQTGVNTTGSTNMGQGANNFPNKTGAGRVGMMAPVVANPNKQTEDDSNNQMGAAARYVGVPRAAGGNWVEKFDIGDKSTTEAGVKMTGAI
jgi:hypothetical protein